MHEAQLWKTVQEMSLISQKNKQKKSNYWQQETVQYIRTQGGLDVNSTRTFLTDGVTELWKVARVCLTASELFLNMNSN